MICVQNIFSKSQKFTLLILTKILEKKKNKTDHNNKNKTNQKKTGQDMTGHDMTGQDKTEKKNKKITLK